jgi:hypothetical protein
MVKAREVEAAVHAALKPKGFTKRGRTFNRVTEDRLVQVIQLQLGQRILENQLTVNLGVFVPEVAEVLGEPARDFVTEPTCCIRTRLGTLAPEGQDVWWPVAGASVPGDIIHRLERDGLPFLRRLASRDGIVTGLTDDDCEYGTRPGIVKAIIVAKRGDLPAAREFLLPLASAPASGRYIRNLAEKLGVTLADADLDA